MTSETISFLLAHSLRNCWRTWLGPRTTSLFLDLTIPHIPGFASCGFTFPFLCFLFLVFLVTLETSWISNLLLLQSSVLTFHPSLIIWPWMSLNTTWELTGPICTSRTQRKFNSRVHIQCPMDILLIHLSNCQNYCIWNGILISTLLITSFHTFTS